MKRIAAAFMAVILVFLMAGCAAKSNTYLYTSKDGDWSINMPNEFVKDTEAIDEQLKSSTITFKTDKESTLTINEIIDEKLEINEDKLKEELAEGDYLEVIKYDTIDIKDVGKAYGAIIKDEGMKAEMIYYRLKLKDKAVSFILYKKASFTAEQIAKARIMINSIKGLK